MRAYNERGGRDSVRRFKPSASLTTADQRRRLVKAPSLTTCIPFRQGPGVSSVRHTANLPRVLTAGQSVAHHEHVPCTFDSRAPLFFSWHREHAQRIVPRRSTTIGLNAPEPANLSLKKSSIPTRGRRLGGKTINGFLSSLGKSASVTALSSGMVCRTRRGLLFKALLCPAR